MLINWTTHLPNYYEGCASQKNPKTYLNEYKHLKNGYLKIIRVIATGKGTLGIPYKFDNPKTIRKSKNQLHFMNMRVDNLNYIFTELLWRVY